MLKAHTNEIQLSEEEKKAYLAKCFRHPIFFCTEFFPEKFPTRPPWFHWGLMALWTEQTDFLLELKDWELKKLFSHFVWHEDPTDEKSPSHQVFKPVYDEHGVIIRIDLDKTANTLTIIPRGFSKTTLLGLGGVVWGIVFQMFRFLIYASETGPMAEQRVTDIRRELETNPKIKYFFGELRPDKNDIRKWTNEELHTMTDVYVKARGRGSQVRGMNINGKRPDRIIFDDLEDIESVRTVEQREKTLTWFRSDFEPIIDSMNPNTRIFGLGTVLGSEALLQILARDPDYTTIRFGALDKDGDALWPLKMSIEQYEAKKESFATSGKLSNFYLEYMNMVRADEGAKFKGPFIYNPKAREESVARALVIDPSISNKPGADLCGFGLVSVNSRGNWDVLEAFGIRGLTPREQIDTYFQLSIDYRVNVHGVESIAYQAALVHFFKEEMLRRKHFFEVTSITHGKQRKDERVEGTLQPRYANGFIRHAKSLPQLETQLLDWPNGKKDVPDAVAMAISLLDNYAPFAAFGGKDPAEDEAEPLGEWRSY